MAAPAPPLTSSQFTFPGKERVQELSLRSQDSFCSEQAGQACTKSQPRWPTEFGVLTGADPSFWPWIQGATILTI